jgi:hypothetical protein
MDYLVEAIRKLKPGSEFAFSNNDYSTIKWDVLEGEAPSHADIDAAIEQIKVEEAQAKLDKVANKATAQAKLAALGLTTDDLKALGLETN